MARCGCNTAMSTTCDAIMSCIAANLGLGLDYNEATGEIELRISTDAGNTAGIGTDDGFYAPTSPEPGDMVWPRTVATLPDRVISAASASNLVGPANSPEMIDYSIANGIDMYAVGVYGLADGTIFEGPGAEATSVTAYTDNPGGISQGLMSSLTVQQLHYDAGTRVNPTGRNSDAPTSLLTPDGGWGGFYAPVYKPRTISETLRIIRGQMVVHLSPQRLGLTPEEIERDIQATVDTVVAAGAQDWVIITVPPMLADNSRAPLNDWVGLVLAAGITAGVNAFSEYQMPSPFTAAEIVASGATWVHINGPGRANGVTDARITELVTAGLEVVVSTDARQYWTTHAFGLGARAVQSADAVYARGSRGEPGDLNYRQDFIPGLETRTTATGALTPQTSIETAMWHAGFARLDQPGRWFPEGYGWQSGVGIIRNNQLMGTISPIPNATNYRLRVRAYREGTSANGPELALYFGYADDRDFSRLSTDGVKPFMNGYVATLRAWSGSGSSLTSRIYRVTAGLQTSIASSSNTTRWRPNEWVTLSVTVTPTSVSLTSTDSAGSTTISANDTTYRGPYVFSGWDDQSGTYVHGYDNPTDRVTYEALS